MPPPQEAPSSEHPILSPPRSFVEIIRSIIPFRPVRLDPLSFRFDACKDSLKSNERALENFGYDLDKVIAGQRNKIISPGSEFRDPLLLSPLLSCHPYWKDFRSIMTNGVSSEFKELSEE